MNILSIRYYLVQLREFIAFLIRPEYTVKRIGNVKKSLTDIFVLLSLKLVLLLPFLFILQMSIPTIETKIKLSGISYFVVLSLFIAPFIEEVMFRLSLVFKPIYLSFSVALFSHYLISNLFFGISYLDYEHFFWVRLVLALLVFMMVFFVSLRFHDVIGRFWMSHFKKIYYFTIFLFGFLHIFNHGITKESFFYLPFLVVPQIFGGALYGYIRMKYGIVYSFLIHSVDNILPVIAWVALYWI